MLSFLTYKFVISSFVKLAQKNGGKEISELLFCSSLSFVKKFEKKRPFLLITNSFFRSKPFCEIKSVKIAGVSYKLPVEIKPERQKSIFFRWLLDCNLKHSIPTSSNNLSKEIVNSLNASSKIIKLCDSFHKTAEINKIYITYRF